MSQQYLLPCSCGQKVRVDAAQAGGTVRCNCGQSVSVPTFRGLKQLEPAPRDAAQERSAPERNWSQVHGAVFSVGMALVLIAVVVATISGIEYARIVGYTVDKTQLVIEYDNEQIDLLPADQSLEVFRHWQEEGLGEQHPPDWVKAQKYAAGLRVRMLLCGAVALVGLIAACGAVLMRPARHESPA